MSTQCIFVSPQKKLYLEGDFISNDASNLYKAFTRGIGHGLLFLDIINLDLLELENESFSYWKNFVGLYLSRFSTIADLDSRNISENPIYIEFPESELNRLLLAIPPTKGYEYVDEECLKSVWCEIEKALMIEIQEYGSDIIAFFTARHSDWNLLGRVCFHLAENKNSLDNPFAFLATYAHQVEGKKSKHLPLSMALDNYSETNQKNLLLRLLEPISKASQESDFLKESIESGDIYHPLSWSASEAYNFLRDIPIFEKAGIVVKVPNWWKKHQSNSPKIDLHIGEDKPDGIGFKAMLDFKASIMLNDETLNEEDIKDLLLKGENLVFFKGQWVEVDKEKLEDLLGKWKKISRQMQGDRISFSEGLRLLSGVNNEFLNSDNSNESEFTRVTCGKWLEETIEAMRKPGDNYQIQEILNGKLNAKLRIYQNQGVSWLHMLNQLRLGAILADDMGLGKTIQIISLLLLKKLENSTSAPSLLIVPASLIGNWKSEIIRFAPTLDFYIFHQSENSTDEPSNFNFDLIITTYGSVVKYNWLGKKDWDIIILDEAQAIKNPNSKQTKAIKSLKSIHKIALTGTPVENRLADLWSLFDFISPGFLGSLKDFGDFMKKKKNNNSSYSALRSLVSPYILRRMKTDKKIISDLPDKTELKTYCELTKSQIALYQQAVDSLDRDIKNTDSAKRQGIIFSYLIRFKQICNHPSQWVKDGIFGENDSGKFLRLKEICEVVYEKQEKILVFTQFQEMTGPIANFLQNIFGRPGLILHGGTDVRKRAEMVEEFQKEDGPPYFVLSLKAGGTGLNLTAASHVVHFDRWWNPAIENQATDRAFRIGQKRNVLVHKFICKGTLEDKIDKLIELKQNMSKEILTGDGGVILNELSNSELLKIVSLDIKSAKSEL